MEKSKFYNLEAEAEVLGSILIYNDSIISVVDKLDYMDFYNDKNKIIYKVIKEMYESNVPIDIITLCEKLGDKCNEIGGVTYISQLCSSTATSKNIAAYGEIVKEKSNCRQLHKLLKHFSNELTKDNIKTNDVISSLQNKLLSIEEAYVSDDGNISETLENVLIELENRFKNDGVIQGIKSGYSNLDKILCGFTKQDFIVIAARPSMGKTAMAINLALNMSIASNKKVAFFNLEMGKNQIMERALSVRSHIKMDNIKKGALSYENWESVVKEGLIIENSGIKIFDKVFTLRGLWNQCKKLKLQNSIDVVIIDYLQLIDGGEKKENRTQEISNISRGLKLMAKELDITVIALSQLSRATEGRTEHRPMLSDLRDSGSIEQDADVVMFLYRDEYYDKNTDCKGIIECIIAKHRNGRIGTLRLNWDPEYQKISEATVSS